MIIGILSDTHDNLDSVARALRLFEREGAERLVHAGDWVSPFCVSALFDFGIPVFGVYGNNDGDKVLLDRVSRGAIHRPGASIDLGGWRTAVFHEPDMVEAAAASGHFRLVVYGHDHQAGIRREGDVTVLNPGEAGGWVTKRATVATVDTVTGEARIHEL